MRRWAEAAIAAVQTLTRIPVPSRLAPTRVPDSRTLALSTLFYPLVGAVLGLLGWAAYAACGKLLTPGWSAAAALALWALATGALHEDGLADCADAFGSQRSREEIFRVLKDSRIGAYGALALMLAVLIRWQALAGLRAELVGAALVASQVLPRVALAATAWLAGPAGEGSGGALAAGIQTRHWLASSAVAGLVLVRFWSWDLAAAAVASCAVVLVAAIYFRRSIGGVTGDCLGATAVLCEIAVLAVYSAS